MNPVKRHYLPKEHYPLLIEALHWKTRDVVWSAKVDAPDGDGMLPIQIPALRRNHGFPVAIRITFGDGEVQVKEPAITM